MPSILFATKNVVFALIQSWILSKNLHRRIFRLKILHCHFNLISTVLVGKKHKQMSKNWEIYTAGKNFTKPPALAAWTNSTSALITKLLLLCVVMDIPCDSNFISIKVSSLCAHYSDRYLEHAKLQRQPKTTKLQMNMRKYIFFPDLNG